MGKFVTQLLYTYVVGVNEQMSQQADVLTAEMCLYMSRLMGKPTIRIGENKDADQLRAVTFVFAARIVQFLFYSS